MTDSSPNYFPDRKNPASGVRLDLSHSNIVFLTITTANRSAWIACDMAQQLLHQTWSEATAWVAGEYLLMPDHLHLFCAPRDLSFSIETWINYWKREFKLKHGKPEWKFQSRGWHHRLRSGENYSEKWLYVQENPLRAGLVSQMEDWKFKGRVYDLRWTGK